MPSGTDLHLVAVLQNLELLQILHCLHWHWQAMRGMGLF